MGKRQLLFSVTEKDVEFKFQRGRGNGGQKKNKTSSACICTHPKSGAQGYSEDHREQSRNKKTAFQRMAETPEFKAWLNLKIEAACGNIEIQEADADGNTHKRLLRHEEV